MENMEEMFTLMCNIFIMCFVLFLFVTCFGWYFNAIAAAVAAAAAPVEEDDGGTKIRGRNQKRRYKLKVHEKYIGKTNN
jgi:hypothetical protein